MSESYDMIRDFLRYGADILSAFADWIDDNKEQIFELEDDLFSRLDECVENHDRREEIRKDEADCVVPKEELKK